MERLYKIIFLFFVLLIPWQAFADEFVLVTSTAVEYQKFSSLELRKVFLGYSLRKDQRMVQAVINKTQKNGYDRFLQMVVSMSSNHYEKQLLSQSFRQGRLRPEVVEDTDNLRQTLIDKPGAISFMWRKELLDSSDLRVIQVLWKSSD